MMRSTTQNVPAASRATRLVLAGLLCLAATGGPIWAQALPESFKGLAGTGNEPINIEADELEVHDNDKMAVFTGNVHVVQGEMSLRSKKLRIDYKSTGKDFGKSEISKIEARGNVLIENGKTQSASANWALFDVDAQTITIGGNVILSQQKNTIRGDRLVIDLTTRKSRFVGSGPKAAKGRVKGVFVPKSSPSGKSSGKPKQ